MSQKGLWKGITVFIPVFIVFCTISNAYSSGFAIYTQGASSLGQGAATIAHTEEPSAIFFNPALINKLDKTQIELGTTIIFPSREFKSGLTGKIFKADSDVFYPSTLFVTHKFNEKFSAGLGVFNPFGLATKWPDDWEGRFITTNSEMRTYNINPVVSYQITPHIAFAAGVDFLFLDATLEKKINLFSFGEAGQKFKGDGNGVGCNFGILIEPHKDISIGASYRSEIKVDIDGDATFDIPEIALPQLGQLFPNTSGSTDLTLPQQVHFGIYYKGLYPLTFEIAARWEGWSSFDRLEVKLNKPVGPAGETVSITKRNWKDTWSGNIGLKYQVSEPLAFLAGYLYHGNPVPEATFDPSIPDANGHLFSIGADVKHKSLRFGLAYSYQKLQDRNKNNSVDDNPADGIVNLATTANGKYKSSLHMVGVSLTYKF
jgi:long-chain fatty acid transport protein